MADTSSSEGPSLSMFTMVVYLVGGVMMSLLFQSWWMLLLSVHPLAILNLVMT